MIDYNIRQKAKGFILKNIEKFDRNNKAFIDDIENCKVVSEEYVQAAKNLIQARLEYIKYIEKYQDSGNEAPVMLSSFPGITSHLPRFSADEMIKDSQDMKQLANIIYELSSQVSMLEEQLNIAVSKITAEAKTAIQMTAQATDYLDQLITSMDSVYDVGNLAKR